MCQFYDMFSYFVELIVYVLIFEIYVVTKRAKKHFWITFTAIWRSTNISKWAGPAKGTVNFQNEHVLSLHAWCHRKSKHSLWKPLNFLQFLSDRICIFIRYVCKPMTFYDFKLNVLAFFDIPEKQNSENCIFVLFKAQILTHKNILLRVHLLQCTISFAGPARFDYS